MSHRIGLFQRWARRYGFAVIKMPVVTLTLGLVLLILTFVLHVATGRLPWFLLIVGGVLTTIWHYSARSHFLAESQELTARQYEKSGTGLSLRPAPRLFRFPLPRLRSITDQSH